MKKEFDVKAYVTPSLKKLIMELKGAFFIMMVSISTVLANSTYSQITSVTLDMKSTSLEQVMDNIESQSEFYFIFNQKQIDVNRVVSVRAENKLITDVLSDLFTGTDVNYIVLDRKILLTTDPLESGLLSISAGQAYQPRQITGTVTDKSGMALPGANVVVTGTNLGVLTNMDGKYSIDVPAGAKSLTFSFVGMQPQEIIIGESATIDVIMVEYVTNLGDVVVIGYGTARKESLTSAVTSVNAILLENRPVPKLSSGLQGLTPGVYIRQQTGRPGYGASTIDIRGASLGTFSSNPPLILIDGIVDAIDNINPADIEKISILKDAAAAAIYGSRATGGVVLITTKRGASGVPTLTFSSTVGVQQRPFGNYKLLNTASWMRANNEAATLDGSAEIYTEEQIAQYENSTDPQYPAETQWLDWIKESALQQNYNINIKGGSENFNFYGSVGYDNQDGWIDFDNYSRINLLLNLNNKFGKRLEVKTSVSYIKEDITNPSDGAGRVNDILRNVVTTPPNLPYYLPNGDYNNNILWGKHPVYVLKEGGSHLYDNDLLRMGMTMKYKILEGLSLNFTTAANMYFYSDNNLSARLPYKNNEGVIYKYSRTSVNVTESWSRQIYHSNQLILDYNKDWNNHSLKLLGGLTTEDQRIDYLSASASEFPNNEIREISGTTGTGSLVTGTSSATDWALASLIGRLTYSFKNKYLFESSIRYDGSSRFSPENRWGLFPSVALGWRISQESFLKNVDFISDLKIRTSYGELGNQGSTIYPFAQSVTTTGRAAFGNGLVAVAKLGNPVNLGLSWEKKRTVNAGLDYGFFNNRLSGSFDYFYDRTSGIIGSPTIPSTYGASSPIQNTYVIDNNGFEFDIMWNDRIGDVGYFIGFNLSDSRDKVISLGGIGTTDERFGEGLVQIGTDSYLHEGEARNHFYLYKTNGLFVDQDEINDHAFISTLTRPGDISFTDVSKDGSITPLDMVPDKRTSSPHYFFGLNLGVDYKNFDLSVVINGIGQRWYFRNNGGIYLTGVRPTLNILQENYDNRWTEDNPDKWADQPRLTQNNWIANTYSTLFSGPCEYHLRNFKYLRVKNIQLGYNVPSEIVRRIRISKLRVYTTLENVFTYAPGYEEPIDPESVMNFTNEGSAFFGVPRIMTFGLTVAF